MENTSGLVPLGRAVLLRPYEPEKKESLIELPDFVKERTIAVDQRAVVVAIGPAAWVEESCPRAAVGDKVLVAQYSGHMAKGTKDGEWYRLVNDRDIFAGIKEEA